MMPPKRVSFIGLGEMGAFMAKKLVKKGFELTVYDVAEKPVKELQALGAKSAATCKEAAETSDVTIIMVRDDPQIDQVVYGENGVWEGVKAGSIIIISSTVDPLHCQRIASKGEEKGVKVLDAPVSGGWIGAEAGTLTFMIGGDKGAFEECRPVFEAMGKNLFYLGGSGMGEVSKLVNNFIMAINLATLSEGLGLARKAGLDSETFINVVKVSSGTSWYAQNWELAKEHVSDYCQGRKGALWFAYSKDMGLALKLAEDVGQLVPLGGLFSQLDPFRFFPGVEQSFYDYGPS
ncbi:MAG: NAD(P)-dependent oxidoreductase [Chloroflexi bacterium]|nr:NAD(P)-dependent oxidoreductase [Chloroflexota bacterium]